MINNQEEMKNDHDGPRLRPGLLYAGAGLLIIIAGVAIWQWQRRENGSSLAGRPVPKVATSPVGASGASALPVDLTLDPPMVERAGLKTAAITRQPFASTVRTTATVQPNSYRETPIMPLVEGRVTKVHVQLGDKVRAGQTLASIFSAELAEAQMKYLTVDANRQFHIDQARRFEKLAEIGAVSRQEEEEVTARLREHHAEHASLRERMLLYGLTQEEISQLTTSREVRSEVPVHAPAAGTITTRDVNIGQNLTMRDRLFTITDLTSVWVVANVYEKDFAIMQPGRKVTITTQAWPGRSWAGRIAYIDPRIIEQTRTAQVRIEVPNLDLRLKIGMFVDVDIESGGADEALALPKAAVQSIGDERIVFVPVGPGRFQVRRVMLGEESGDLIRVINGLTADDQVVTEGSFFLRAELGRKRNNQ